MQASSAVEFWFEFASTYSYPAAMRVEEVARRLCAEFSGAPSPHHGTPLMAEVARRFSTLSAPARRILEPFFIPPIYEASWFTARMRGAQPAPVTNFQPEGAGTAQAPDDQPALLHCGDGLRNGINTVTTTAHTNIYHPLPQYDLDGGHAHTANVIATYIERIYTDVTGLFGRFPASDGNLDPNCNGGDGKLDIYTISTGTPGSSTESGLAVPYLSNCNTPRFILIQVDATTKLPAVLAHEFFHTVESGVDASGNPIPFSASCSDYTWLGEATANWVIDHVFAMEFQYEHTFAPDYMFDQHLVSLDQSLLHDEASPSTANGYTDYVFFQYLAKKYNPGKVKAIWDATRNTDSVGALKAAGDLPAIWHDFALATWNDHAAHVQEEFYRWDDLTTGIKAVFDSDDVRPRADGTTRPSTKVDLRGAPEAKFELMKSVREFPGSGAIDRLSFHYDYLKFTDPAVSYLRFENVLAAGNYKILALQKIGGSWRDVEDWSSEIIIEFCRDKIDERLEELVLIYSNGTPERAAPPMPVPKPVTLYTSNVGCFRWSGTSETTTMGPAFGDISSATVVYERDPTNVGFSTDPIAQFVPRSGTAVFEGVAAPGAPCRITTDRISAPIAPADSLLLFPLPSSPNPQDRRVDGNFQQNGTYIPNATQRMLCDTGPEITNTYTTLSAWLRFPDQGAALSADGRTLFGTVQETISDPGGGGSVTMTTHWDLRAERE